MVMSAQARVSYDAARNALALAHQTHRRFLGVTGKAPGDMLLGILTSGLPEISEFQKSEAQGRVVYSAILDAKGRVISDLRVFSDGSGGFVLDVPESGVEGVTRHLATYLPPRLAGTADLSQEIDLLTLAGPEAAHSLATGVFAGEVPRETLEGLGEGEELVFSSSSVGEVRVVGNGDLNAPALDLLLPSLTLDRVRGALLDAGGVLLDPTALDTLRIEKGRPAYGVDMDATTLLVETGLHTRVVDEGKGCYVGQEVIIRIRDRGRVNKALRGFLLGNSAVPPRGEEIFLPDRDKAVGWITSACESPSFEQTLALGYLRRGVEPGGSVRVGSVDGPVAEIRAVGWEGWE
jgi:folate-binding protein YgfZ